MHWSKRKVKVLRSLAMWLAMLAELLQLRTVADLAIRGYIRSCLHAALSLYLDDVHIDIIKHELLK